MFALAIAAVAVPGLPHTLSLHLTGPPDSLHSVAARFAGDVDGDGYGDVLTYAVGNVSGLPGTVYVRSGRNGARLHSFSGIANSTFAGVPMDGAGDVNGDGFGDVLVGNSALNSARIHSGLDGGILFEFTGIAPNDAFGGSVSGVGDVNGDGHADVMVGTTSASPGYAIVYSGANGAVLHAFAGNSDGAQFGTSVCALGDVNGDGHVDFGVGAGGDGHDVWDPGFPPFEPPHWTTDHVGVVAVFSGYDGQLLYEVYGRSEYEGFGYSLAPTGDVDGDDHDDFVVGTASLESLGSPGYARLVSGVDGTTIFTFLRNPMLDHRMVSVSGAGDVDHDGVPDVLVGATSGGSLAPHALVFSGQTGLPVFRYAVSGYPLVTRITVDGSIDANQDGTHDFVIGVNQPVLGLGYADLFVSGP